MDNFVYESCKNRDMSHGYDYASRVKQNALNIYYKMSVDIRPEEKHIIAVSMLHDVADHKYDKDGKLREKLQMFLNKNYPFSANKILDCIDAISFTRELKDGKRWFVQSLGKYWTQVRDIVSDADKLEAIGKIGVERCLNYGKENGKTGIIYLLQHMVDKLLILRNEYIVTEPGLEMAQGLHDEMVNIAMKSAIDELKAVK